MLTHRRTILVEWGDCDPAGIVHSPRYFGWIDGAVAGLFDAAGLAREEIAKRYGVIGFPVVGSRATFRRPSSYGDALTIESAITRWGTTSFDVQHRFIRPEGVAVEIVETRVWTRAETAPRSRMTPQPIPEDVIRCFGGRPSDRGATN